MGRSNIGLGARGEKWIFRPPPQISRWCVGSRTFVLGALIVVFTILFFVVLFHPTRHACQTFSFVPAQEIHNDIVTVPRAAKSTNSLPPCSFSNSGELPSVPQRPWTITADDLALLTSRFDISPGGHGRPTEACQPQAKVAIIVPYRDRPDQLQAFLWYMHHFLSMQYLDYVIIIVEQSPRFPFNRAKLFNVGFVEALALDEHLDCFFFHDVDLLPENLLNIYGCSHQPRHVITSLNTFRYTLQSCTSFGGVVAMTKEQFKKVNGCANRFFGWGAEDDDFRTRVLAMNYSITRWDPTVATYTMMIHDKAIPNPKRHELLKDSQKYLDNDGLLTLRYKRLELEKLPLYTRILVDL